MPSPSRTNQTAKKSAGRAQAAQPAPAPAGGDTAPDQPPVEYVPPVFDQVPVHVAMARVLAELPAVAKDRYNEQQKFHFRGIDDAMNALNPILSRHGVFFTPHRVRLLESGIRETRNSKVNGVMVEVTYRFYGPCGDYVEAQGLGEGTDSLDKATPKSLTGSMKYMLFQVFAISTEEADKLDNDNAHAPGGGSDDLTVHACPVCAKAGTAFQNPDKNKVRKHLVDRHGYTRLEDGSVVAPQAQADQDRDDAAARADADHAHADDAGAAAPQDAAAPPLPSDPPPAQAQGPGDDDLNPPPNPVSSGASRAGQGTSPEPLEPEAESSLEPDQPSPGQVEQAQAERTLDEEGGTTADDEYDWVWQLKGQALKDTAGSVGVAVSGKVDDIRAAIVVALKAQDEEAGAAAEGDSPADGAAPEADGPGNAEDEDLLWCPLVDTGECDSTGFATDEEYQAHWAENHEPQVDALDDPAFGPGETDPAMQGTPPRSDAENTAIAERTAVNDAPAAPELIAQVKAAIGGLAGQAARKYSEYRRTNGLGKPDDLTHKQATDLLAHLTGNGG